MNEERLRNQWIVGAILLYLLSACNMPVAQDSIAPEHEPETDSSSEMSVATGASDLGVSIGSEDEITPVERTADLLYPADFGYPLSRWGQFFMECVGVLPSMHCQGRSVFGGAGGECNG